MPYKNKEDAVEYERKRSQKRYSDPTEREKIKKQTADRKVTFAGKFTQWKHGAKVRQIEWTLTKEYLKTFPMVCSYTGVELTFERNKPNTVSLDRIDSSKGYVEGNVCFCSARVNIAKSTLTTQEFIEMCSLVAFNK